MKNKIALGLAALSRPFRNRQAPRYLVVSTTGLGDTLWGTPAIRALRRHNPSAYIAVLTTSLGQQILKNNPHIDECFILKNPALPSLLSLFSPLRKREISKAYIFHTSQRPVLPFCSMIGCVEIVGTSGLQKGLDALLTRKYPQKPQHEIDRRLELVDAPFFERALEIFPDASETHQAGAFLSKIPSYVPTIGLHPGAKDRFKQWPIEHFIRLGKKLQDHFGASLVITGGADEKPLVEALASNLPGSIVLPAHFSIGSLAAAIKEMSLFISNDTGPMHLASAVKTPVIAPFAPTNSALCGPLGNCLVIQKKPTCTPCLKKRCRDPFCLRQISVEAMFEAAQTLFYQKKIGFL